MFPNSKQAIKRVRVYEINNITATNLIICQIKKSWFKEPSRFIAFNLQLICLSIRELVIFFIYLF